MGKTEHSARHTTNLLQWPALPFVNFMARWPLLISMGPVAITDLNEAYGPN